MLCEWDSYHRVPCGRWTNQLWHSASIASVVRTAYTDAYSSEDNYLYKTGKIVLWTVIECGVGIIAGSLPMVKGLTKKRRLDKKFEELELQHAESTVSLPMPARTRR